MRAINFKRAEKVEELQSILKLQAKNLPDNNRSQEQQIEGFVTVEHNLSILQAMNQRCPHIIAIDSNKDVIGYALSMHPTFKNEIDILKPMFVQIERKVISNLNYMVMGQICIAKDYRQQGIFRGLYNFMESELKNDFDAVITEVDAKNKRSLNAHLAANFVTLSEYYADNRHWILLVKYWNKKSHDI